MEELFCKEDGIEVARGFTQTPTTQGLVDRSILCDKPKPTDMCYPNPKP